MSKKAMIAMSGGVDSSVAAFLMIQEGYECSGVTMKLHDNTDTEKTEAITCLASSAAEDARLVAESLGIPFSVCHMEDLFHKYVIDPFVLSYLKGDTPNPCICCNRHLKFRALLNEALSQGMDFIASGHYAQSFFDPALNRWMLKKGADSSKDQSYVLYSLTQNQLSHTIFPLGGYTKAEIRQIADEHGFVNAHKSESQDICFIPDGNYASFIERYTGKKSPEGNFVLKDGTVIGRHKGIIRYTLGQRRGLGVSYTESLYVCEKQIDTNTVVLGNNSDLFQKEFDVNELNLIAFDHLDSPLFCKVKTRYRHKEQNARIEQTAPDKIHVIFDEPQRAITPGQAAVFYSDDMVLGGGTITSTSQK